MKKFHIIIPLLVFVALYFIWIGFIKKYNTYIAISDYTGGETNYDVEIILDGKSVIIDTVNLGDYAWPGKIHKTRIYPGTHKIIAKSDSLNLIDSISFLSLGYTRFYIEYIVDSASSRKYILIDKRFGRKFVFE